MAAVTPNPQQKKALFSIEIDDLVIQKVFHEIQNEVVALRKEVKDLHDDVLTKPSRSEITNLSRSMDKLEAENTTFISEITNQINEFKTDFTAKLNATQTSAKNEIVDAIFSINSVARAQNALIEEKIFELTKPTMEFEEMRQAVKSVKKSHEEVMDELKKVESTVAKVLEVDSFNNLGDCNLSGYIKGVTSIDRDNIAKLGKRLGKVETRVESAETTIHRIARNPSSSLPQWKETNGYDIKNKPKIPELVAATTYVEYLDYLMLLAPSLQDILDGFYQEMTKISNKVWENKSNNLLNGNIDMEKINSLIIDVNELKIKAVSKAEVSEIKDQIAEMRTVDVPKLKINKITSQIEVLKSKVDGLNGIDAKVDTLQHNFDSALANAIREVKSVCVTPNMSPRFNKDVPAKTSVTPRAAQAHKLIYGEFPQKTQTRPESRTDRKPVLVRKPSLTRKNDDNYY